MASNATPWGTLKVWDEAGAEPRNVMLVGSNAVVVGRTPTVRLATPPRLAPPPPHPPLILDNWPTHQVDIVIPAKCVSNEHFQLRADAESGTNFTCVWLLDK